MALDQYDPCPCGSGKKFKWCCLPIHVEIDRAYRQEQEGQHDSALRIMDEVIAAHPDNPEPLGRKAHLLYEHGKAEEAETVLEKAFTVQPNYAFGLMLRGMFRMEEGEIKGAVLSFRKAADAYDPQAHDHLSRLYQMITDGELKMNRPVAAFAAIKLALHYQPANEELRKGLDQVFGPQSRLPAAARQEYKFKTPATGVNEAWTQALSAAEGRLSDAAKAFDAITRQDANNAAAWFNLGLARAWLGENRAALEALDRYVALEADVAQAAEAWTLGEVLRQGHDMADACDFVEQSYAYQFRDMAAVFNILDELQRERRFVPFEVNQEQHLITGLILEKKPALTPELAATQVASLGSFLLIIGDHLRIWHTNVEQLEKVREELAQKVPQMQEVRRDKGPATFNDMLADVLAFPVAATDEASAKRLVMDHTQRFFEETWIHRSLKTLGGVPPVDAATQPVLKKKVLGAIQWLHDCAVITPSREYDFDRLRRKLGVLEGSGAAALTGAAAPAGVAAPAGAVGPDIGAMGAAELAALPIDGLPENQLEQAYQTAIKLDARDLAGRFALALVTKPIAAGQTKERFPWFSHLIQLAQSEGKMDAALDFVNDGEKDDCEHNEGRRRNDYELRRGQLHAKRGEIDAAADVFERLTQRVPDNPKYRGSAAEAMLSAKRGDKALHFAETGLNKAREKNDRDSEQYFLELVDAAKRMK
jgi:predicted Zn-dependent protease